MTPSLWHFALFLLSPSVRICARKAAEKLAPRPLIVGVDLAHRFREKLERFGERLRGKELGDIKTERRADEGLCIAGFAGQLRGQLVFCHGVRHAACGAQCLAEL